TCDDGEGSGCASIHYTTDGSIPSAASTAYTAPLTLTATTRVRFLAVDLAGNASDVVSELYTLDATAPVATATPPGGTYGTAQQVTLSCSDGEGSGCAAIHYTLDGSAPTLGSPVYQSPLQVSATTTLRFFAVDAGGNAGEVQTQTYVIDTSAPLTTASPAGGTFGVDTHVTLTCDDGQAGTGCAVTRYTEDGTAPTDSSPRYTGPITVTSSRTLRFFSVDAAGNREPVRVVSFTIDRGAPTTTPSLRGGNFANAQTVSLSCADTGGSACLATHFTTDGSLPSTSSPLYTQALRFESTTTLRFFSVDAVGNAEVVKAETYVIDVTPPTTTATPRGGTYRVAQDVVLACNDGAGAGCAGSIRYSTDPTAPVESFLEYSGPLRFSANTTLRFFSRDGVGNTEGVKTEAYVIDVAAPTVSISPQGGTYFIPQTVTLTCTDNDGGTGCAAIHYTRNGGNPDTTSPRYTGPLTISTNSILRVIAVDNAGNVSVLRTEVYSFAVDTVPPSTAIAPPGTLYRTPQQVTLTCTDNNQGSGCAATYYTLDGSNPTPASTRYTGAFTVDHGTTEVRYFSADVAGNRETVKSSFYFIDTQAPVTRAVPAGGSYQDPVTVMLECTDSGQGCRATHYTTDGSVPDGTSPLYTGPFTLTRTTTVRFFSQDHAGNDEAVKTEVYELPISTSGASIQIATVRSVFDGFVTLPVEGALITYVKPGVGSTTNDPAGFFLQAERAGPALFVEVDPTQLFPWPEAGMRVSVTVTQKRTVNGMVRATIDPFSYAMLSSGHPVEGLAQNVSNVDLPTVVAEFESELIALSGTLTGDFFSAGAGHAQANVATVGVPEGSPSSPSFRLRVVDAVREQVDITRGCTVSIVSPLWYFANATTTTTQPSVWESSQLNGLSCPGPRATSAQASAAGTVIVRFDRRLDTASVLSNGSQFTIPGLLVTGAFVVTDREVWLSTSEQFPRQSYTVTVDSSVRDSVGTGGPEGGSTTTFSGWFAPAVLRITEIAPGVAGGRDLVELRVLQSGSTAGMTFVDLSTASPLVTLPDVEVTSGDLIVLHLNPDRVTSGADAPESELISKTEHSQFVYTSNFDSAWDFQGTTLTIGTGNRVFRLRDALGNTQDALAVYTPGNTFAQFPTQLQSIQAEGQWLPINCGGAPCSYSSFPTAYDVSVNWSGASPSGERTTTLGRVISGDNDLASDWAVGASTLGFRNP
ncbi:chitobiase/beta-hexosaminidase C-terminal domain-containing protein, partial [Pyxidicoccus sp. 3LG]